MVTVWYLFHSGVAVETDEHFLLFDYWTHRPGGQLCDGYVDPAELLSKGKTVVIFVSHRHHDHYNPVILEWKRKYPEIVLVLSNDITVPPQSGVALIGPGESTVQGGVIVRALASNDEGVAFFIRSGDFRIFHAGDLGW